MWPAMQKDWTALPCGFGYIWTVMSAVLCNLVLTQQQLNPMWSVLMYENEFAVEGCLFKN